MKEVFERAYSLHNVGRSRETERALGARHARLELPRVREYQAALLIERFRGFERQQETPAISSVCRGTVPFLLCRQMFSVVLHRIDIVLVVDKEPRHPSLASGSKNRFAPNPAINRAVSAAHMAPYCGSGTTSQVTAEPP